jgi:hypothetical protein
MSVLDCVRPRAVGDGGQESIKQPQLGLSMGVIDTILSDDKQTQVRRRRMVKRIFEQSSSSEAL